MQTWIVAADLFLGFTTNNIALEGNPWRWESKVWNINNNFDVSSDFPSIRIWESNLPAASHNLCFRHRREDKSKKVVESQTDVAQLHLNDDNFSELRSNFPNTPHHVFIAEAIRRIMKTLKSKIYVSYPFFKGSVNCTNNGISFRYILNQLASSKMEFFDLTMLLLYALPSKCNDLEEQISNINDVIHHIREKLPMMKRTIYYIKMCDSDFDASQESYSSSQESVSNYDSN